MTDESEQICAAALVAALGASLVGGTTAFADAKELNGKGTVTVDEGTLTGTDPIPDPEKPEEPFTPTDPGDVTENPDRGSIIIQKVTNLDFDTISTSNKVITKFAKPVAVTDGKRGAVVGWSDIRANETYGYTITASMSQQFTGATATNKLTGATIQYKNGFFVAAAEIQTLNRLCLEQHLQLVKMVLQQRLLQQLKLQNKGKERMRWLMEILELQQMINLLS
ncbi:WxL domain-containing protein [Enterococcus rivorum]|uniref:WxL domain-containing protein n=1 Tax=Enterococcus rivorum TaxID=762845 RepID=UPI00362D57E3